MKKRPSLQSYFALNCLILLIAGLQAGVGPFLAIYLKSDLQWDPSQIGIAIGIVNFAAMLNQVPSGLLIDEYKIKRLMLGCNSIIIATSCFVISRFSSFSAIVGAQFFIGLAIAIIPQAIVAITLGLVGTKKFPKRESTNESLSHAGNKLKLYH